MLLKHSDGTTVLVATDAVCHVVDVGSRGTRKDGRLSILRLEQLLKEKIMNNTTFQVKRAAENGASIGGGSSDKHGAASAPQERQPHLDDDVEVKQPYATLTIQALDASVHPG